MKVLVVYYSTYGHTHKMAEAVAEGVREVEGAEVEVRRVPETLPQEVLEKMGAIDAQKAFSQTPVCTVDELAGADAIMDLSTGGDLDQTPTTFLCTSLR